MMLLSREALEAEVRRLESSLLVSIRQEEALTRTVAALEGEVSTLQGELADCEGEIFYLEGELEDCRYDCN